MCKHVYIHVPFCHHICSYCDFAHVVYNTKMINDWFEAITKEIHSKHIPEDIETLYIGGGTPSALNLQETERLLELLAPYTKNLKEYTIEVNPESLDKDKAKLYVLYGINRVSMGLQTTNNKLLQYIGRKHTFSDAEKAMEILHQVGITNISLDLMYGLPNQSIQDLKQSVLDTIALEPTHLSLYSLTIEPNTVFAVKGIKQIDEDTEADMYEWICKELPKHGYIQYEISNFAKNNLQSQHNLAYWHYEDFIGIGCGASGKEDHYRYDHPKSLSSYLKDPLHITKIPLSTDDEKFEMIMMNLRLKKGMDLNRYQQKFHEPYQTKFGKVTNTLIFQGLLTYQDNFIKATDKGYEILNEILVAMLD